MAMSYSARDVFVNSSIHSHRFLAARSTIFISGSRVIYYSLAIIDRNNYTCPHDNWCWYLLADSMSESAFHFYFIFRAIYCFVFILHVFSNAMKQHALLATLFRVSGKPALPPFLSGLVYTVYWELWNPVTNDAWSNSNLRQQWQSRHRRAVNPARLSCRRRGRNRPTRSAGHEWSQINLKR